MNTLERLADKWIPEPNTGCYIWLGWTSGADNMRPTWEINGKKRKVARVVCEEAHGPPPTPKHQAAHIRTCVLKLCINPDHVYWATNQQNCMDKPSELRIKMASIGGKANGGWNKGMKMRAGKYLKAELGE